MNLELRLDTIESGSSCRQTTSLMYINESSDAFTIVLTGIRWTIDVNLHMITQRSSYPCDLGNRPTKSMPIDPHGLLGMGSRWSRPTGFCILVLFAWQTLHESQHFSTSTQSQGN